MANTCGDPRSIPDKVCLAQSIPRTGISLVFVGYFHPIFRMNKRAALHHHDLPVADLQGETPLDNQHAHRIPTTLLMEHPRIW